MSSNNPRQTATFDASATSSAVNLRRHKIVAFHIPSGMLGVSLTFLCSPEESSATYRPLYDDAGTLITITIAASRCVVATDPVKSIALAGAGWTKLVSGSAETLSVEVESV